MDETLRQITKIARTVNQVTVRTMKETGIGTGEYDLIHTVRHNPGISQKEVSARLNMDKGAVARRVASLENKGYLMRKNSPEDGRVQMLFATEKAENLRHSKATVETVFYEWLLEDMDPEEKKRFCHQLHLLYAKSKLERRADFPNILARLAEQEGTE